jgi:hypothetical protein
VPRPKREPTRSVRVSASLVTELEAEAEKRGVPVRDVADDWLERGRSHAAAEELMGFGQIPRDELVPAGSPAQREAEKRKEARAKAANTADSGPGKPGDRQAAGGAASSQPGKAEKPSKSGRSGSKSSSKAARKPPATRVPAARAAAKKLGSSPKRGKSVDAGPRLPAASLGSAAMERQRKLNEAKAKARKR